MTDTKQLPMQSFSFDDLDRMAVAVAKSGLFGCKAPEQALALLLLSQAEGLHPMRAAADFDIIQGRPARKSHSILARFQEAGGAIKWLELTDQCARATFSHPQGGAIDMEWTIAMAKRAGLSEKDVWKAYPRAMLRSRCITEGVRAIYPAAIGGLLSTDEAGDMEPIDVTPTAKATVIASPRRKSETEGEKQTTTAVHTTEGDGPAHPNAIKSVKKMADAKQITEERILDKFGTLPADMSTNTVNECLAWLRNGAGEAAQAQGDLV